MNHRKSPTLVAVVAHIAAFAGTFVGASATARPQAASPTSWQVMTPTKLVSAGGATLTLQADGTILVSGEAPDKDTYTLDFVLDRKFVTGLRLEVFADASLPSKGPGRAGNFVLNELKVEAAAKNLSTLKPVALVNASCDFEQSQFPVVAAVDGAPTSGWAIAPQLGIDHVAVFELPRDLGFDGGTRLVVTLDQQHGAKHTLGRFRFSFTTSARPLKVARDDAPVAAAQGKVPASIERGVQWLLDQQELDGSWSAAQNEYHHGMTALACYTLVKCGLAGTHPAVMRAVSFMDTQLPARTYEAGLELMARGALDDPNQARRMQEVTDRLLSWQIAGWAYPSGNQDLSNTQYAALGLRYAALRGVKIPPDTWLRLGEEVLLHQEKKEGAYEPAGFGYARGTTAYGSMTAAGVGVMRICSEQLGKAPASFMVSEKRGIAWLDRQFSPAANPFGDFTWIYYYLYGIERVGGLCNVAELNGKNWYREGARFIIENQEAAGSWEGGGGKQPSTCFALLFLAKATTAVSGAAARSTKLYGEDSPKADVSLRASGDTPLTIWVSSFGERPLTELAWPQDAGRGLRVSRVDYVLPGRVLLPDARTEAGRWRSATEPPPPGWEQPGFNDEKWKLAPGAFGIKGTPGTVVRTEWTSDELWLRRDFTLDDAPLVDPTLFVQCSGDLPPVDAAGAERGPLVCLFDEDEKFPALVNQSGEGSVIKIETKEPWNGKRCLVVTPVQIHNPLIPGWGFPITEKPLVGEYRWLRFAWKKEGGSGVMIQLAENGSWGSRLRRLYSGPNDITWPGTQIEKEAPKKWAVVTVDLWKEFGGNAVLTGISFVPMQVGVACYDALWLARSVEDFKAIPRTGVPEPAAPAVASPVGDAAPAPRVGPTLEIWVNGTAVLADDIELPEYGAVSPLAPLGPLLKPGRNIIALHACRIGPGQSIDVGLRDQRVLATVPGNPLAGSGSERWATQVTLPCNGVYDLRARVHTIWPAISSDAEAIPADAKAGSPPVTKDTSAEGVPAENAAGTDSPSQDTEILESAPLFVTIREAQDEELLSYAKDPGRNLLAAAGATVSASSFFDSGTVAAFAADNFQARGWRSADGDTRPSLSLVLNKPVRADTILVSPLSKRGLDPERTFRVRRVEIQIDGGKGGTFDVTMPDEYRKGVLKLPRPTIVRRVDVKIVDVTENHPTKSGVGLAEIELEIHK